VQTVRSEPAFEDVAVDLGSYWVGEASFYNSIILDVSFRTLTAQQRDPFDLDAAAAAKRLHDHVMEHLLGPPRTYDQRPLAICPELTATQATLAEPHYWKFSWGLVCSGYTFKTGISNVTLIYGARRCRARLAAKRGRDFKP
jgi:hypothetical protein